MCSIVGSFDRDRFLKLIRQNSSRGTFSHSLTIITPEKISVTHKGFGAFDENLLDYVLPGDYMLGHCQAPTGGLVEDVNRIHPAEYISTNGTQYKLLHNGIIMDKTLDVITSLRCGKTYRWDTQALLELITYSNEGFNYKNLELVEGSFACALIKEYEDVYFFRNQASPLFISLQTSDISSTLFDNSISIPRNHIMRLNFIEDKIEQTDLTFNNKHTPFFFAE